MVVAVAEGVSPSIWAGLVEPCAYWYELDGAVHKELLL